MFGITDLVFLECESNPAIAEFRPPFEESRQRLLTIMDDALLLCQIEAEGTKFAPQSIALQTVLAAALEQAGAFARLRNVSFGPMPECNRFDRWPRGSVDQSLPGTLGNRREI